MKYIKGNYHYIVSALAIVGVVFAATNLTHSPLFNNLDNFVLFASEEIKLEKEAQVSSGDLGSNNKIDIEKDAVINGNLFANKISADKDVQINGNVSYNKLETHKDAKIFGTKTSPVALPIANLPAIPDFQAGAQDFKFTGQNNTLAQGSYQNITLEKDSRLLLTGGTYNLSRLNLKENSILIYATSTIPETTVIDNFETEAIGPLKGQNGWVFSPATNPDFTVQSAIVKEGRQAVKGACLAPCPTNFVIGKALATPITDTKNFTTFSFDLRVDNGLAVVPMTDASFKTPFFIAHNAVTGSIFLTARPKTALLQAGAKPAVWNHFDVHIDLENQRVQARINNGAWSPFLPFALPVSSISRAFIRVGSDLGPLQVNTIAYFDNLQLTVQKPSPTIVNIQKEFKTQQKIAVIPASNNLKPTDLIINYQGREDNPRVIGKQEFEPVDQDEGQAIDSRSKSFQNQEQEEDDCLAKPAGFIKRFLGFFRLKTPEADEQKCSKPVKFGQNSFLNFKLLAPEAEVNIGENSTLRGQVLARKVRVGRGVVGSRADAFTKEPDPAKVITDTDGSKFIIDEIMVNFVDSATFSDAQSVANLVGGRIVGFVQSANAYQIEITANTTAELAAKIQTIRQSTNPLIEGVFRNYIFEINF